MVRGLRGLDHGDRVIEQQNMTTALGLEHVDCSVARVRAKVWEESWMQDKNKIQKQCTVKRENTAKHGNGGVSFGV